MKNDTLSSATATHTLVRRGRAVIARISELPRVWNYVLIALLAMAVVNLANRAESRADGARATPTDRGAHTPDADTHGLIAQRIHDDADVSQDNPAGGANRDQVDGGLLLRVSGLKVRVGALAIPDGNHVVQKSGSIDADLILRTRIIGHLGTGDQVHIRAKLVNAEDGFQLWSEEYEGDADQMDELCGQITTALQEGMRIELPTGAEGNSI